VIVVSILLLIGVKPKYVATKRWKGFISGNRAVAVFQDRTGIISVGYFSNIKKWNCYPYAVSADKRGVYLQVPKKRGIPWIKSIRWDKGRLRIQ
jgi:hypothetical protein